MLHMVQCLGVTYIRLQYYKEGISSMGMHDHRHSRNTCYACARATPATHVFMSNTYHEPSMCNNVTIRRGSKFIMVQLASYTVAL